MKIFHLISITASVALTAFAVQTASAAPVLDQQSTTFDTEIPLDPGSNVPPVGQSFTAGLNGLLTDITLSVGGADGFGPNGSYTFSMFSGNGFGGLNLGSITNTYTVPFPSGSPFAFPLDVNLSSLGVNVVAGSQYTFQISNVSGALQAGILASDANPYAGGQIYTGPGYNSPPSWDLSFQTFVDQSSQTPPAPSVPDATSTLGLLGLALAGIAGVSRRRHRA